MAQIKIFDEATGVTKVVTVDCERGVLASGADGGEDTYLKLSVDARTVGGDRITPYVISSQQDLVLGTTQYNGSTAAYADLGAAVDDYVLRIKDGEPGDPDSALDFTS